MCKELILSWQDIVNTRLWFPIARLTQQSDGYLFRYVNGVKQAEKHGFLGLAGLNERTESYYSEKLFPLFQNRILNKSRPDRSEFLDWLGLTLDGYSEMEELARSGGVKVTDQFQLFPVPEQKQGRYQVHFFAHGVRHLAPHYQERVKRLEVGEKLYLCPDPQNEKDSNAVMIRTENPVELVGYAPKFLAKDFVTLIGYDSVNASIRVVKANPNAPDQMKLLCLFDSPWMKGFTAFADEEFSFYSVEK
jgi:hypothetical protein